MKGHGAKFSRKMEDAVAALLTQRNQEEAVRAVGIGTATLLRWQKEPEFQAAYRAARRAAHAQSVARLQQATSAAVTTLLKVMVDPTTHHPPKSGPPIACWVTRRRPIELEDIEARVAELERAAEATKPFR